MNTSFILELIEKTKNGDEIALKKLSNHYLEILCFYANRYNNQYLNNDMEDIASDTLLGLIEACKSYDKHKIYRFEIYLSWWLFMNLYIKHKCGLSYYEAITTSKKSIIRQIDVISMCEIDYKEKNGNFPTHHKIAEILENIFVVNNKNTSPDKIKPINKEYIAQFRNRLHI